MGGLALAAVLLAALAAGGCAASGNGPAAAGGFPASASTPRDGRDADAVSSLPQAADEEPDQRRRARVRTELAASYYQQRNFNVALEEIRQAIAADPGYAPAYGLLGLVYMDLGERERAEDGFRRGLRIAPADSELNNNYGWFLCQSGREAQAIPHFLTAVKNPLYPTPARPWHNAGLCAMRLGDVRAAEDYFQRAFQLEPANPVALFNLGDIYLSRGEVERAKFYVTRLMSNYEPTAEMLWLAYRVERRSGDRDAAASYASQLRRRYPGSREASQLASEGG